MSFFSIIIPTYNRANFLSKAIQSVLNQTYSNFELIIIDDGSTDGTKEIVSGLNDERIRYVYQENKGRSDARNLGIELSIGEYICFLDDDDFFLDNHLETMLLNAEKNKGRPQILIAQYEIEKAGKRTGRIEHPSKFPNLIKYIWDAFVPIQSICFPKEVLQENRFPVGFHIWEDKHLLLRLVLEHPIVYISTITSVVVDHKDRSVNRVDPETFQEDAMQMIKTMDNLLESYGLELSTFLSEKDINKKKSESLVGKALDAVGVGEKKIARTLLFKSMRKYFQSSLILTYLNTARKILLA